MTRRLLTAVTILFGCILSVPSIGPAQTFKVEKFDIKGDGGTDYVAVEPATGRVFVSRSTHMMVVEGATGRVLGDISDTPGVHGAGIATTSDVRRREGLMLDAAWHLRCAGGQGDSGEPW